MYLSVCDWLKIRTIPAHLLTYTFMLVLFFILGYSEIHYEQLLLQNQYMNIAFVSPFL